MFAKIAYALSLLTPFVAAYAPGLELAYSLERATQGISISSTERKFLFRRLSTTLPPQTVELLSNNQTVLIDGARIGPDGRYWLVDGGSSQVNGSAKLVGLNLSNDTVDRIYYLDSIEASNSGIDDVRFNAGGDVVYLSDTTGALLVLNLTTSTGVRVLADDPSASAYYPMSYNGSLVPGYGAAGSTLSVGLDQIEVSPDCKYLYHLRAHQHTSAFSTAGSHGRGSEHSLEI